MRSASIPCRAVLVAGAALIPSALVLWSAAAADEAPKPPAKPAVVDNPGNLNSIAFELGGAGDSLTLAGRDARRQLLVAGTYASGATRDLTRAVTYTVDPATIAQVEST